MRTLSVIATATMVLALSGTALAGSAGAAELDEDLCTGMPQPAANTTPGNTAPTATADAGTTVAGGTASIKVLANDTDPEGNPLSVTGTSEPSRGSTCVEDSGVIEYGSEPSRTDYTVTFSYGVTDGGFYRTGTVTVTVTGTKVVRAQLRHKLGHGGPARVAFTNTNTRAVIVEAGARTSSRITIERRVEPGQTAVVRTKIKRLQYFVVVTPEEDFNLLDYGMVDTRTGKQSLSAPVGDDAFLRASSGARATAHRWLGQ